MKKNTPPMGQYPQDNARKRVSPLSVIIALIGVLCLAAALVLPKFLKKSVADTDWESSPDTEKYSFLVTITNDDANNPFQPTSHFSVSYENTDEWLDMVTEALADEVPSGTGELNSEIFVVPPMKITIDKTASRIFKIYPHTVDATQVKVCLNHSVETSETYYDENVYGYRRFFIFTLNDDGELDLFPLLSPYKVRFDGTESPAFAVVDMDKICKQLGVDPSTAL